MEFGLFQKDLFNLCKRFKVSTQLHDLTSIFKCKTQTYAIAQGADQSLLTSKYEILRQYSTVQNYAKLITTLSEQVQDGIVVTFPTQLMLEHFVQCLNNCKLLTNLTARKVLLVQTSDITEQQRLLQLFELAVKTGRGCVLFAVAGSRFIQGLDFQYSRLIIVIGAIFPCIQNPFVKQILVYEQAKNPTSTPDEFLNGKCRQQV